MWFARPYRADVCCILAFVRCHGLVLSTGKNVSLFCAWLHLISKSVHILQLDLHCLFCTLAQCRVVLRNDLNCSPCTLALRCRQHNTVRFSSTEINFYNWESFKQENCFESFLFRVSARPKSFSNSEAPWTRLPLYGTGVGAPSFATPPPPPPPLPREDLWEPDHRERWKSSLKKHGTERQV